MKKFTALLLIFASLLSFCACSSGGGKTEYRSDASVSALSEAVCAADSSWNFTAMNESYVTGAMKLDTASYAEYIVNMNALGTNVDEFGIFKAKSSDDTAAVKEDVENYLQLRLDSWMEEYMPEEKPKLENAEIRVCGLYVMYAILGDDAKTAAFDAFENSLKK